MQTAKDQKEIKMVLFAASSEVQVKVHLNRWTKRIQTAQKSSTINRMHQKDCELRYFVTDWKFNKSFGFGVIIKFPRFSCEKTRFFKLRSYSNFTKF